MEIPQELWYAAAIVVSVVILLAVARRLLRRRRWGRLPPVDLSIDVAILGESGPPEVGPVLEWHGVPVRLAAVVLAPSGRARPLPSKDLWPLLWDAILPGFSQLVKTHQPLIRIWPAQLSESGFIHRFFAELKFPEYSPGSSPWSAMAGPVRFRDQTILVGMVFRAGEPTSLGTEPVEEPSEWRRRLSLRLR